MSTPSIPVTNSYNDSTHTSSTQSDHDDVTQFSHVYATYLKSLSCLHDPPHTILMCGIAGSGKSTFSKLLELDGFTRLSIDEEVWNSKGRYGIDYKMEDYSKYVEEARTNIKNKLIEILKSNKNNPKSVVIDSAFWNLKTRDEWKQLIECNGGKWKLVYLKVDKNELKTRLQQRSKRFDANSPFQINDDQLDRYFQSFEEPNNEGEMVVQIN